MIAREENETEAEAGCTTQMHWKVGGGGNKRRVEREIEAEAAHPWTGR